MTKTIRTHLVWSIEGPNNTCPQCGNTTVLVIAPEHWIVNEDSALAAVGEKRYENEFAEGVSVYDELTGHYCGRCERLVSLHLNTQPVSGCERKESEDEDEHVA